MCSKLLIICVLRKSFGFYAGSFSFTNLVLANKNKYEIIPAQSGWQVDYQPKYLEVLGYPIAIFYDEIDL